MKRLFSFVSVTSAPDKERIIGREKHWLNVDDPYGINSVWDFIAVIEQKGFGVIVAKLIYSDSEHETEWQEIYVSK